MPNNAASPGKPSTALSLDELERVQKSSSNSPRVPGTRTFEELPPVSTTRALQRSQTQIHHQVCMFCGGPRCKYEDWTRWLNVPNCHNAFDGIYSNWITDNILAHARPVTRYLRKYKIIEKMAQSGIAAIVNLQEPGEHPHCGDGNEDSGFSYFPDDFMKHGIHFYQLGWRDMSAPTLQRMLDVVQIVASVLEDPKKKISVHCHAGLGRTGLVIACYLVFRGTHSVNEAIDCVRVHRPGSIQTKKQVRFITTFQRFINGLRVAFAFPPTTTFSLEHYMKRQRLLLHGPDSQHHRYVPRVMAIIINNFIQALGESVNPNDAVAMFCQPELTDEQQTALADAMAACNTHVDHAESINKLDLAVQASLMMSWLAHLYSPVFHPELFETIPTLTILNDLPTVVARTLQALIDFVKIMSIGALDRRNALCKAFAKVLTYAKPLQLPGADAPILPMQDDEADGNSPAGSVRDMDSPAGSPVPRRKKRSSRFRALSQALPLSARSRSSSARRDGRDGRDSDLSGSGSVGQPGVASPDLSMFTDEQIKLRQIVLCKLLGQAIEGWEPPTMSRRGSFSAGLMLESATMLAGVKNIGASFSSVGSAPSSPDCSSSKLPPVDALPALVAPMSEPMPTLSSTLPIPDPEDKAELPPRSASVTPSLPRLSRASVGRPADDDSDSDTEVVGTSLIKI